MVRLLIFFLGILLFTFVKSDIISTNSLKNRLKNMDNVYACFSQKVDTSDNNVKEINQGELWIKQPNLFHCHISSPRESFLISDGKTIWFYVPIIGQVIMYNFATNLMDNIFLKLLFNSNTFEWDSFDITQKQDWFYLRSICSDNANFKKYKLKINEKGIIDQFSIIEPHGQCINYYLFNQRIKPINISKFQFNISRDIQVDDQRQ